MERMGNLIEKFQAIVGASDTKVAATADFSTNTFRRAKKGDAPLETQKQALRALEKLRIEKIEELTNFKVQYVS
jgi:hypothetical protein